MGIPTYWHSQEFCQGAQVGNEVVVVLCTQLAVHIIGAGARGGCVPPAED